MSKSPKAIFGLALPIMLSYVAIGLPCGVLEAQCGLTPWMAFLFSATFYSGAGQFMTSNLWLAGVPVPSIILSVAAVSLRQALYAASLAPYLERFGRVPVISSLVTVTDESYGVNLSKFQTDEQWTATDSLVLNLMCMLSWSGANALGVIIGAAVDIPTAIASFAMTSLFICLLLTQPASRTNSVAAAGAVAGVILFKLIGLASMAVPCGAALGVVCAIIASARGKGAGASAEALDGAEEGADR